MLEIERQDAESSTDGPATAGQASQEQKSGGQGRGLLRRARRAVGSPSVVAPGYDPGPGDPHLIFAPWLEEELDKHPQQRPLFEAAAANFSLHSPAKVNTTIDNRGPLLLIMGGQDHTVPEAITKSTLKQYRHSHAVNDLIEFPDRGHSLTIDHGWRDVASACLDWLYKNSL